MQIVEETLQYLLKFPMLCINYTNSGKPSYGLNVLVLDQRGDRAVGRGGQAGGGGRSNDQASGKCHRYQTV